MALQNAEKHHFRSEQNGHCDQQVTDVPGNFAHVFANKVPALLARKSRGPLIALFLGKRFVLSFAKQWKPELIAGLLSIVSYGSAMLAIRFGATPRLAALRETSILFGVAIAVVFLKERLTRCRMLGIASIAVGTILLV